MKNLMLSILLGISALSAMAEIRTENFGPPTNDQSVIKGEFHFTVLNIPNLNYGRGELWLQGIMIFDFFFYPDTISSTSTPEAPDEAQTDPAFTSNYVSLNFPCGHFGNVEENEFFPVESSDSDIQECGREKLRHASATPLAVDLLPIPEPGTTALMLLGLTLMGLIARRDIFTRFCITTLQ